MASLEADKIGASVAPGKNHYSRVRVYGANVLTDCLKNKQTNKQTPKSILLLEPPPESCDMRLAE